MFDINAFAEQIKKYRTKLGIRQNELASKLHVSPQSVSKWEQGNSVPEIDTLCRISEFFGVSVDELLSHKYPKERMMIGVDGGGTKTEFLLFSEKGTIKQRILLDGSNPNVSGLEKALGVLAMGIDSLIAIEPEVMGIYCGLSGYTSGNNSGKIKSYLTKRYPDIKLGCNSDIFNVAASATQEKKCIAVICGTGACIFAINGDKSNRIGGLGYLFEGKGSGFDIGRDAVAAALADNDGIGQKTIITELVQKRLGTTVWEGINRFYSEDISFVASFTSEVFEAYRLGDKVAKEIVESNINALCDKINFASKTYACGDVVVLSGGVFSQKDILLSYIRQNIGKNKKIIIPEMPQIYGACVLCTNLCGISNAHLYENFVSDYKKYL